MQRAVYGSPNGGVTAEANLLAMKIVHVVGARPNFMKVAPTIEALPQDERRRE
jgi:hypothetical protein